LLTGKLNTKVSNGPWLGGSGKREGRDVVVSAAQEIRGQGGDPTACWA
jgi:hypothetical protein